LRSHSPLVPLWFTMTTRREAMGSSMPQNCDPSNRIGIGSTLYSRDEFGARACARWRPFVRIERSVPSKTRRSSGAVKFDVILHGTKGCVSWNKAAHCRARLGNGREQCLDSGHTVNNACAMSGCGISLARLLQRHF
jgi:hypothetical protein